MILNFVVQTKKIRSIVILEVEIWFCLCYVGVLFGFGGVICYLLVCLFVCLF